MHTRNDKKAGRISKRNHTFLRLSTALVAMFYLALNWGCDTEIITFSEENDFLFAVHGYLDSASDTQFVRVQTLRPYPEPQTEPLSAHVGTRALQSGQTIAWKDSLVTLDDGSMGFLFFAVFKPEPGETYELFVRNDQGEEIRVQTTVPANPPLQIQPAVRDLATNQLVQSISQPAVPVIPRKLLFTYRAKNGVNGAIESYSVEYPRRGIFINGSWQNIVTLQRDVVGLKSLLRVTTGDTLFFYDITMYNERLDARWNDQFTSSQPVSEITNGDGFWGAVGRYHQTWQLDSLSLADLSFLPARR